MILFFIFCYNMYGFYTYYAGQVFYTKPTAILQYIFYDMFL